MALPWKVLDWVTTREGVLELRQRGPMDVQIAKGGLVLMNSAARRSEEALGAMACYETRLQQAGFSVSCTRPGRGGLRHVVYLAQVAGSRA